MLHFLQTIELSSNLKITFLLTKFLRNYFQTKINRIRTLTAQLTLLQLLRVTSYDCLRHELLKLHYEKLFKNLFKLPMLRLNSYILKELQFVVFHENQFIVVSVPRLYHKIMKKLKILIFKNDFKWSLQTIGSNQIRKIENDNQSLSFSLFHFFKNLLNQFHLYYDF